MGGHWLVKQEPAAYAWETLVADGRTDWTGVRNFQARTHLRAMRLGDDVLYYHSVVGKAVVGLARVSREAFPDPTAPEWSAVELVPVRTLGRGATLARIKALPALRKLPLVRQSRLSVMPVSPGEFRALLELAGEG